MGFWLVARVLFSFAAFLVVAAVNVAYQYSAALVARALRWRAYGNH